MTYPKLNQAKTNVLRFKTASTFAQSAKGEESHLNSIVRGQKKCQRFCFFAEICPENRGNSPQNRKIGGRSHPFPQNRRNNRHNGLKPRNNHRFFEDHPGRSLQSLQIAKPLRKLAFASPRQPWKSSTNSPSISPWMAAPPPWNSQ